MAIDDDEYPVKKTTECAIPLVTLKRLLEDYEELAGEHVKRGAVAPKWEEFMTKRKMLFVMTFEVARRTIADTERYMAEMRAKRSYEEAKKFWHLRRGANFRPPSSVGTLLERVASFLLSKRAYGRVIAPLIADMRQEYAEAVAKGDLKLARFVILRGYVQAVYPFAYGVFATIVTLWKLAK